MLRAGALNGATHAVSKGKGGRWASLFGASLANTNTTANTSGAASSGSPATATKADLSAQLAALLQGGTSMATIVDQLAQSVGSSAAKLLAGKMSTGDTDRLRNSITQTIAKALSPPSNAPPGTPAQEAAALAARLRSVVESIARETQDGSGQQNEITGNLLDANSAKELPAQQQQSTGTSSPLDVSSVVRALLASVISTLSTPNSAATTAPTNVKAASSNVPAASAATANATTANVATLNQPLAVNLQSALDVTTVPNSTPSTLTAGLLSQSAANAVAAQSTQSITMANAPDLLARMLVRAAGLDSQINGSSTASAQSSAGSQTAGTATASALTPDMLAARFAALLAEVSPTGVAGAASSGNTSTDPNSGHAFDQNLAQQDSSNSNAANNLLASSTTTGLASQVQTALQSAVSGGTAVDANAVMEQMVKGMVMRTAVQGTSEIRLQLQPENLGQVTMRLTVSGNQVSANVVAQNADVSTALVANHQELARSLAEAGLTLTGFSVDVSGGDAGQDQSKDRTGGFGRRYVVHELSGDTTTEATQSGQGPPLLGGSGLELFNSLA